MGREVLWWRKALAALIAALIAASLCGALVGQVGLECSVQARSAISAAVGICLIVLPLAGVTVFQRDKETPQLLLGWGPYGWATANGALLGLGFTSRLGFWIWYLVPLGAFISTPRTAAVIWATYAFVRLSTIGVVAWRFTVHQTTVGPMTESLVVGRLKLRGISIALSVLGGLLILTSGV